MLALVTGAAKGIGRAVTLQLAHDGFDVAINYAHSEDAAKSLRDEVIALRVKAEIFRADVSFQEEAAKMFADVKSSFGENVSVLVNNAGITRDTLLMRMKAEDWLAVINTNLNAAFYCTQLAVKDMAKARYGRIISISSVVGLVGNAGQCNYSASKAGIIGFTKSVAREYAGRGITANAIAPGFIDTGMTGILKPEVKDGILKSIPVGRIGDPEDVARAVSFFASEKSAYITGQTLAVDGGMIMI
ncbi:MAG: 3-oxoacyl-[Synergistaceae bacterium]|nr:3-oxoacyl-[acyl-carrier-protein] reductase [Synergistaceae bacterium]MBQ3347417.1 3-oxoacyl-[acyl-carrier-protein] reductase [Synergistaceae bacterium]MBQ4401929.1 3-oxoacyl-[acyl-carrier-protein] reductase [Synergistaceae bacterium]MBQ6002076.1 3-oxoacyl-[acyl-carrier-protein] reductase [Synergistaceae bacterium]MBQ6417884.1 3-oxoacyl-[acyl-carrier-protein] reductase [Synergistaceae bacterium]